MLATHRFEVWSTSASVVVTDPATLSSVVEIVLAGLDDVDRACSRFRADSELAGLTAGTSRLSPLLPDLVGTALDAAEGSGGLGEPTGGRGGRRGGGGGEAGARVRPEHRAAARRRTTRPRRPGRARLASGPPVRRPA